MIGGVGGGEDLQRAWFTEERLGIAAHGIGAMWRLLEETVALGDSSASRAATGSSTTRGSASRSPTRPPTPRPAGC